MEMLLRALSCLLLLVSLPFVSALKFDIEAHPGHESASKERCVRNFVMKDQLVVVTTITDGYKGDGQRLNMHVRPAHPVEQARAHPHVQIKDAVGNDYGRPKDVVGENRYAFTSVADSAFDVCFENVLEQSASHTTPIACTC